MKKLRRTLINVLVLAGLAVWLSPTLQSKMFPKPDDSVVIAAAFEQERSNLLVEAEAQVVYVIPVVKHKELNFQEFRVELSNGHRVRVIHDLNQADAVPAQIYDKIRLRGEFDWSSDGGLIHWTHDDPSGEREGGWIELNGRRYL